MGSEDERRKLRAQASVLKGALGEKAARKDLERLKRHQSRHRQRPRFPKALIGALVVLLVLGIFTYRHLAGPAQVQLTEKDTFMCERCRRKWTGEVVRNHVNDPYVECDGCGDKAARRATRCRRRKEWTLEPIPKPPKPFADMGETEMHL